MQIREFITNAPSVDETTFEITMHHYDIIVKNEDEKQDRIEYHRLSRLSRQELRLGRSLSPGGWTTRVEEEPFSDASGCN